MLMGRNVRLSNLLISSCLLFVRARYRHRRRVRQTLVLTTRSRNVHRRVV